jgi:RNA polymerase sigma factor (sigma-70 family)
MRAQLTSALAHLRRVVVRSCEGGLSDADLLHRFVSQRDEAAFEVLIWRHGPMVLAVAGRVLRNSADAEDVFQATFLALVRQAKSIGRGEAVASWLYRVGYRTAIRVRLQREKHAASTSAVEEIPAATSHDPDLRRDTLTALDEELHRLADKYRTPLVLSYLQGLTNQEIAAQMGCPIGTVFTRLARGRDLLRKRLRRRGATAIAALPGITAGSLESALPLRNGLVRTLVKAGGLFADGSAVAGHLSPRLSELVEASPRMALRLGRVKVVAAALILAAIVGAGTGLLTFHRAPPEPPPADQIGAAGEPPAAAEPKPPPAPPAEKAAPPKVDRPRVVAVFPADAETDVEPVTEMRVRFDRPMNPTSKHLEWPLPGTAGFRLTGEMRYAETTREFVFPVQLTPGVKHEVVVNSDGLYLAGEERNYRGFRSEEQVAALPFKWSFTTAKPAIRAGKPPRVTALQPPADTEVSLLTPLELTFDRPMDPQSYGLSVPGMTIWERHPDLLGSPQYDAERHRFRLLVRLPANWYGELRLEGFRDKDGVPAEPLAVKYRTLQTAIPPALQEQLEAAGRSEELRTIVESARKARRDLKGDSEKVVSTMFSLSTAPGWLQSLWGQGSRFQIQGRDKYVGVIDDVMLSSFRVGCDGNVCWARFEKDRHVIPVKEVAQQNVLIADAFDAYGAADTDRVIRDMLLEYLGQTTVHGRRCHRIRSWGIGLDVYRNSNLPREWLIDAVTLLPLRIDGGSIAISRIEFTHILADRPVPDEEFQPDSDPAVHTSPEPLSEGYATRFITVIDGSSTGRMSVRWGQKGTKGTRSGGLN